MDSTIDLVARGKQRTATSGGPRGAEHWMRYRKRTFWMFVSPWVIGFILLTLGPMAFALWMSFTDYDGISPKTNYVGFGNFDRAFHDHQMWASLSTTLLLMVVIVPLSVAFGLGLAVLLNLNLRGRGIYRAIIYLPAVIPPVAGSLTFRLLFDHDAGAVNGLFKAFGASPVQWLTNEDAIIVLISLMLWGVGASMIISLAALQGVPRELSEAATMDGAGAWHRFSRITVPIISPLLLFQVITGVIASIQMFVPALLIGTGGNGTTDISTLPTGLRVYMLYVYQQYFTNNDFGYASALLWLLFIVIVIFTALVFRLSKRAVFDASSDDRRAK
jgi:multiple sugar transport system permease protein